MQNPSNVFPASGYKFNNENVVGNQAGYQEIKGSLFTGPVTQYHGVSPTLSAAEEIERVSEEVLNRLRDERLRSLDFDRQGARYVSIKTAYAQTCEWALHRPQYSEWLDDDHFGRHNGFLWIKGKPGTGKSTLMKFLIKSMEACMPDITVVSFFFNARGDNLEKATIGMYRAILLQIFTKVPELQSLLDAVHPKIDPDVIRSWSIDRLRRVMESKDDRLDWTLDQLQETFQNVVKNLGHTQVVCFVDALDECDEDEIRDMIDVFTQIGETVSGSKNPISFRTCFSSRHYPHIAIEKMVSFTLEEQPGHDQDLQDYVNNKLKLGKSERANSIKRNLIARSSGIFLWVVLVVQLLRRDYDHGQVHKLQDRLDQIPSGLQALLDGILLRDGDLEPESILCLQFVMFSCRPLLARELYFGVHADIDSDLQVKVEWSKSEVTEDDITRFILSISKGLVEVVSVDSVTDNNHTDLYDAGGIAHDQISVKPAHQRPREMHGYVQLIHESVRQFLIGQWNLKDYYFGDPKSFSSRSHARLRNCCQTYLERCLEVVTTPTEEKFSVHDFAHRKFPFLDYAANNILSHDRSAQDASVEHESFLHKLQKSISSILGDISADSATLMLRKSDILFMKSVEFVSAYHDQEDVYNVYFALEFGATYAFKILFQRLTPDTRSDHIATAIVQLNLPLLEKSTHSMVLLYATYSKLVVVVEFFLNSFTINVDSEGPNGEVAILFAAYNGDAKVTSLLLKAGANITLPGNRALGQKLRPHYMFDNALHAAVLSGSAEVVDLILKADALKLLSTNKIQDTIVQAAFYGFAEIIDILMQGEPLVSSTIHVTSRSASHGLLTTVRAGHLVIAQRLLAAGADVGIEDDTGNSPLAIATKVQDIAMMKLLLAHGANVNICTHPDGSCLNTAVSEGNDEIISLLLTNGADPNVQWHKTASSLYIAAQRGDELLCRKLLDAGANVNQETGELFGNCLQAAANKGHLEVVRMLLEAGADIHAEGRYYGSVINAATKYPAITKILVQAGASSSTPEPCLTFNTTK